MDFTQFNRNAWDNIARSGKWFGPVDQATIDAARNGTLSIRLTGTKPVPSDWIGDVAGKDVLCLAGGGGHQGPVLAAAGANVTVLDFSEQQVAIDLRVAKENGLDVTTVLADVRDLSCFDDHTFDFIVNPCSLNFCPEVRPVWREVFRVLRVGGELIAGMIQPVNYLFDAVEMEQGNFVVRHKIPYSDWDLPEAEREQTLGPERPIDFGHTLTELLGGQTAAGLHIIDLFEDVWGGDDLLSDYIATFIATRSKRMA